MNNILQEDIVIVSALKQSNIQNGNSLLKNTGDEIDDINLHSQKMQALIEQVESLPDSTSSALMQDCIREMLIFYGMGLQRILDTITKNGGDASTKIYNDLIADSFISGLLLIHDLHPLDLKTRLHMALEKVRPYMDSHGGNVEIISLIEGVATLKLSGSCKGCASSSVTLELAIKQAIEEHCPDLAGLEVEGIVSPSPKKTGEEQKVSHNQSGWKTIGGAADFINGSSKPVEINGMPVMIIKTNGHIYAYKNSCPACGMHLHAGAIQEDMIDCRLGHRFNILQAGQSTGDPALHLDPLPLLVENGTVKIAIG